MRWQGDRESSNVEDERASSGGGGGRGRVIAGGGIGTLIIFVVGLMAGFSPQQMLMMLSSGGQSGSTSSVTRQSAPPTAEEEQERQFASVVLADTEDVWTQIFKEQNRTYGDPKMVLFRDGIDSACGFSESAVGPFYCPADQKVYLDLGFFAELQQQLHAPGDFARAYVIAHEVGHHVQKLLGISDKVMRLERNASKTEANRLSVGVELQADFFAGVWANHAQKMKNIIEPGDIDEALNAASQIGDDTLQKRAQGRVMPDNFTHGTSAQRIAAFKLGYETGDIHKGDSLNPAGVGGY